MSILVDLKTGDPEDSAARFQLSGYSIAYAAASSHLVQFNVADHAYTVDGEPVPSVTQILRATGISTDFEELGSMGSRIRQAIDVKREIGTALHMDAHSFDDDDLNWATVHPEVRPYLEAWAAFRAAYPALRPATRERIVYSAIYRFAGTLDGIFLTDGETQIEITERWSVQLTPQNRIPYRVTPYNEHPWLDDAKFRAFVTTYWEQTPRRRAA